MSSFGGGATPNFGGGAPGAGGPPPGVSAGPFAHLPQCAQGPTFGIFAGFAQDRCGQDLACICTQKGFAFLAAVQGATAKTCSPLDAKDTVAFLRHMCGDLVPSLNKNRSKELIASFSIVLGLVWLAVALRFISRRVAAAKLGLDDWLILVALVFNTVLNFSQIYAVRFGAGKHMVMVSPSELSDFSKQSLVGQLAFALSITFAKLSLLFLYHRIFRTHRFTTIGIVTGVIIILWCIATLFVTTFNCTPVRFFWDKSIPGGHCINGQVQTYSLAAASIFSDIFVWVVPIPWLWNLHMNLPKKLGLIGTFALGGFVCIAGVIRLLFIERLVFSDITWSVVDLDQWINIESGIGIVCTCLPILRSLFRIILPSSLLGRFSHSSRDGPYMLSDQSNIRGKLQRIPSATDDEAAPSSRGGALAVDTRQDNTSPTNVPNRMARGGESGPDEILHSPATGGPGHAS